MRRRHLTALVSLALLPVLALSMTGCGQPVFGVGVEYEVWLPQLDVGTAKGDVALLQGGPNIDLDKQFDDVDRDDLVPSYLTFVTVLGHRILLDSFRSEVGGTNVIPAANPGFTFDGIAFNPGDTAQSKLDFQLNRMNFETGLLSLQSGSGLFFIVGLDVLDIDLELNNLTTGEFGELVEHIPMLTIGVRGLLQVWRIQVYGHVQGIQSEWVGWLADSFEDVNDLEGLYLEANVGVRVFVLEDDLAIGVNYRFYNVDLEFGDLGDKLDLQMHGPAISLYMRLP